MKHRSDEYLAPVPSIEKFKLPPPVTRLDPNTNQLLTITWEWAQSEWQIIKRDKTDSDGWEYDRTCGSVSIKLFPRFMRSRQWARNAHLIVTATNKPSSRSSSIVSLSPSVSSYGEDDTCLTPSSSSIVALSDTSCTIVDHHFWLHR